MANQISVPYKISWILWQTADAESSQRRRGRSDASTRAD
ncbi:hypothetical protein RR48_07271 [Papilio machaon]|uniref:Uncharacterized protein n=1 Tax=Papilio machaon TaxID=76193 RepID=A0A194RLY5_PAPMA|nr:hypothetical protein RR48_07271 [Papilio machaon]